MRCRCLVATFEFRVLLFFLCFKRQQQGWGYVWFVDVVVVSLPLLPFRCCRFAVVVVVLVVATAVAVVAAINPEFGTRKL